MTTIIPIPEITITNNETHETYSHRICNIMCNCGNDNITDYNNTIRTMHI